MFVEDIIINPGNTPGCACGANQWIVLQEIRRESKLVRVDLNGDIVVEPHDEESYIQKLKLICLECDSEYVPQSGVVSRPEQNPEYVEAYASNTGLHEWPAQVRGDYK